jgi:hypothetical protein
MDKSRYGMLPVMSYVVVQFIDYTINLKEAYLLYLLK